MVRVSANGNEKITLVSEDMSPFKDMEFYGVTSYRQNHKSKVPKRPTAEGFSLVDHIFDEPITFSLAISLGDQQDFGRGESTRRAQFRWLTKLYKNHYTFRIESVMTKDSSFPATSWDNYIITDMSGGIDSKSVTTYSITITLQQVVIAEVKTFEVQDVPGATRGIGGPRVVISAELTTSEEVDAECTYTGRLAKVRSLGCHIVKGIGDLIF